MRLLTVNVLIVLTGFLLLGPTLFGSGGTGNNQAFHRVPILCYHNFHPKKKGVYSITPEAFEEQLAYLQAHNIRIIGLKTLYRHLQTGIPFSSPVVVLTIDDGYPSVKTYALPLLKKYAAPATLFIYTDNIRRGRPDAKVPARYLTWQDLREFDRSGLSVQSHSLSHDRLDRRKDKETPGEYNRRIYFELVESYEILNRRLRKELDAPLFAFAFPYGAHTKTLLDQAVHAGYPFVLTTDYTHADVRRHRRVAGRYTIYRSTDLDAFAEIVNPFHEKKDKPNPQKKPKKKTKKNSKSKKKNKKK